MSAAPFEPTAADFARAWTAGDQNLPVANLSMEEILQKSFSAVFPKVVLNNQIQSIDYSGVKIILTNKKLEPFEADAVVVADPGTPCPYVSAYYTMRTAGRCFLTNRAHGALGYSMAAALGAWFADPSRRCVSVMGDGSFGFAVGELETVVRCRAPLLMLVLSNATYGWIKASQRASYGGRFYSVDFSRTDHARVAESYGVKAWRVDDPAGLAPALREALEHDGPTLVDIVTQSLEEAAAPVLQWMG